MSKYLAHKIEEAAESRGTSPSALTEELSYSNAAYSLWRHGKAKARKGTRKDIIQKVKPAFTSRPVSEVVGGGIQILEESKSLKTARMLSSIYQSDMESAAKEELATFILQA